MAIARQTVSTRTAFTTIRRRTPIGEEREKVGEAAGAADERGVERAEPGQGLAGLGLQERDVRGPRLVGREPGVGDRLGPPVDRDDLGRGRGRRDRHGPGPAPEVEDAVARPDRELLQRDREHLVLRRPPFQPRHVKRKVSCPN